ncbi:EF-hand calcium-binding domain-containing protein 13 [Sphaerodactylus townsendi]|uniref:EF-hand calcium-binding domain-containing protein 13 n=1 Tax=Sphaerodactylus townsendi TaxID=933632 RepID=UPI002026FAAB|nr:EF-hand calcium-binding domain-containing protein 13 [Sphaerodactylus townsendi]
MCSHSPVEAKVNVQLQEVMKTAKVDQQGNVNFKEFIRISLLLPKFPQESVLKETLSAMNNIKDNRIHVDELHGTLANLGIHLTPQEVQELQSSVTVSAVQSTFGAISKICKEKIKMEDLPAALADLGICLSSEELQVVLTSAAIDESGMLDGTELLTMLVDAPRFTEFVALKDAIKVVDNIKYKNMTLPQLKETLQDMGIHLTSSTFQALVNQVKVDENGEINFKDFLVALGETPEFMELEALQRASIMMDVSHGRRLHLDDLESTLGDVGIHFKQGEFQEALHNFPVADDETVDMKNFLMSLGKMRRFSESQALHSATEAFNRIKGEKLKVNKLESIMESLGVSLSSAAFKEALQRITVDENGMVNFKEFLNHVIENECFSEPAAILHAYGVLSKVQDDKIEISELVEALGAIDITLTNEDMREALAHVAVDSDGKVALKKFMSGLSTTRRFSKLADIEEAIEAMKQIKQDKMNAKQMKSIMSKMGIHLSPSEIQQTLKNVPKNYDGTASLKNFMSELTKTYRSSQAERDRVAVKNLDTILEGMDLSLSQEEMEQALKLITVDEDGTVNLNSLIKTVKCLKQLSSAAGDQGSSIAVEDVNSFLSSMGIYLTREELEEALEQMSVDENGKVNMNNLMNSVLRTRTESHSERKMISAEDLSSTLAKMGIHLTEQEMEEVLKHVPRDALSEAQLLVPCQRGQPSSLECLLFSLKKFRNYITQKTL